MSTGDPSFHLHLKMADAMRANVAELLKGIDRYNPENLDTLERYVELQARENVYDLEANLAILKLYQFNPVFFNIEITSTILLKALTNLPHTDFTLCKCLIEAGRLEEEVLARNMHLALLLEGCQFRQFWALLRSMPEITAHIAGFDDSTRKFICHVVSITYQTIHKEELALLLGDISDLYVRQWIQKYGWKEQANGEVFISTLEDSIKTKNITERITFDSVAAIMANSPSVR